MALDAAKRHSKHKMCSAAHVTLHQTCFALFSKVKIFKKIHECISQEHNCYQCCVLYMIQCATLTDDCLCNGPVLYQHDYRHVNNALCWTLLWTQCHQAIGCSQLHYNHVFVICPWLKCHCAVSDCMSLLLFTSNCNALRPSPCSIILNVDSQVGVWKSDFHSWDTTSGGIFK